MEHIPSYDYYKNNHHALESIHDTIRDLVEQQPKTVVSKSGQLCSVIQDGYPTAHGTSFEKGAKNIIKLEAAYQEVHRRDQIQKVRETPLVGYYKESEFIQLQQTIKLSHAFLIDHQGRACAASTSMQFPHDEFSFRSVSVIKFNGIPVQATSELFTPGSTVDFTMPPLVTTPEDRLAIWHVLYDTATTPEQLNRVLHEIFHPFHQTNHYEIAVDSAESIREHFKRIREINQFHSQTGHGLLHPSRHDLDIIRVQLDKLQA